MVKQRNNFLAFEELRSVITSISTEYHPPTMAFSPCWRCLFQAPENAYPFLRSSSVHPQFPFSGPAAAFSVSATLNANPLKKTTGRQDTTPRRGVKATFTMKKKKKPPGERGKPPAVGERKALRRRIVLSNTNALAVPGMEDITMESMINEESRGKVFGIPGPVVDQLRAVDAFKVSQGWGLFRRPGMLVRKETIAYGKLIEEMSLLKNERTSSEGSNKVMRRVLVGERGSGKSLMLLQAMTAAFMKKWTVINIPEGIHPLFWNYLTL